MRNTLQWMIRGESFSDGSLLADWREIYTSPDWHWQYDTHELSFRIYEHDGQFWKLYRARFVHSGQDQYTYDFGGQACRMALVEYRQRAKSPHSSRLVSAGDQEWIRTYEFDPDIHNPIRTGRPDPKYGAPLGTELDAA